MNTFENSHSTELGSLFEALSKAQGKIENALKDKKNPFFKSSYADLASVWDACRDPLSSNGLSVIQTIEGTKDDMFLNTWIGHSSGQWMKSKLPLIIIPEPRKDKLGNVIGHVVTPQAIGSSITYGRRYALSALVGICADEDDDGEKAMGRKAKIESIDSKQIHPQVEKQYLEEFLSKYPKEEHDIITAYINSYCGHWKKSVLDGINDFNLDMDKFNKNWKCWREKREKALEAKEA